MGGGILSLQGLREPWEAMTFQIYRTEEGSGWTESKREKKRPSSCVATK